MIFIEDEDGVLTECVICGKKLYIMCKENWTWKIGYDYCCSYTCREKLKRKVAPKWKLITERKRI